MTRPHRRPTVELYERVADAIHDGTYPPGSTLPSEPELAATFGVSRPALREALILLQEDGIVTVRRGVGRTVAEHPIRRGFERLQPLEEMLGADHAKVRPLVRTAEEPVDVVLQHLWVAPTSTVRFWESMIDVDGAPVCMAHEWAVPDDALAEVDPTLPGMLDDVAAHPHTMLHAVLRVPGVTLRAASSIVATVLGRDRGHVFERPPETPVVLATQVISSHQTPLFLAKYLLPSGAPALPIRQSR